LVPRLQDKTGEGEAHLDDSFPGALDWAVHRHRRRSAWVAAALAAALVAGTLTPVHDLTAVPRFSWCLFCGRQTLDALFNVLAFAPFGAALALSGVRTRRAAALGFLLSLTVELIQSRFIPGRHGQATDVLTNTLGTALGALVGPHWRLWLLPGQVAARRLALVAATLPLLAAVTTVALLQPSWPKTMIFGQWAPDRAPLPRYLGTVTRMEIEGWPAPNDRLHGADVLQAAAAARLVRTTVQFVSGPPGASDSAPIAALVAGGRDIVRFADRGGDAVFGIRLFGEHLGLRPLNLGARGALPSGPGMPVTIKGSLHPTLLRIEVGVSENQLVEELLLTTGLGWTFFRPLKGAVGDWNTVASALWWLVLAIPAGYYAGLAGNVGSAFPAVVRSGGPFAVAVVLGLWVAPAMAGLAVSPPLEWLGATAGFIAGGAVAALVWQRRST
jgi:hypothetical protein